MTFEYAQDVESWLSRRSFAGKFNNPDDGDRFALATASVSSVDRGAAQAGEADKVSRPASRKPSRKVSKSLFDQRRHLRIVEPDPNLALEVGQIRHWLSLTRRRTGAKSAFPRSQALLGNAPPRSSASILLGPLCGGWWALARNRDDADRVRRSYDGSQPPTVLVTKAGEFGVEAAVARASHSGHDAAKQSFGEVRSQAELGNEGEKEIVGFRLLQTATTAGAETICVRTDGPIRRRDCLGFAQGDTNSQREGPHTDKTQRSLPHHCPFRATPIGPSLLPDPP